MVKICAWMDCCSTTVRVLYIVTKLCMATKTIRLFPNVGWKPAPSYQRVLGGLSSVDHATKVGVESTKRGESGAPTEKENGKHEVRSELYNTLEIISKLVNGMRMRVKLVKT
ncbi:hypothetical protein N7453_011729 [Penicillium expansum]|nr:hypothetical protein N7453_011729 [Penicillium expansum]